VKSSYLYFLLVYVLVIVNLNDTDAYTLFAWADITALIANKTVLWMTCLPTTFYAIFCNTSLLNI